ncbi:large ribosomal subunit protein uL30m [Cylas formicarius]|uniref:large ribosomal subunit protein uL30m n=1 Tax=Cylas formicarius TaxID=197179 RepID=UPI00295853EF|nr:large ribosomal subunit protein uL30m [Cylas formicarius]
MLSSKLLKAATPFSFVQRNVHRRKFIWYNEGIQYPGFKYYPRRPDFQDPPYEPTKLFRVQRIRPMKGAPYWEKNILKEFKLDGKTSDYVVVKNIPENNHRLWKVKHMIKIDPITFPDGFPNENDSTYLQENGELRIVRHIGHIEERSKLLSEYKTATDKMDGDTLRRDSRSRWLTGWQ